MVLEYSLTPEDYVEFNEYAVWALPAARKHLARSRVLGVFVGAMVGAATTGLVMSDGSGTLIGGLGGAITLWIIFPPLFRRGMRRSVRRLLTDGSPVPVGVTRLELSETHITEEISGTTTSIPWESVDRVDESDNYYYVLTTSLSGLIVPKNAPGAPEAIASVQERVAAARR